MDHERTREVLAAFEREGVQYVIFGSVALNLQDWGDAERLRQRFGFEDE